MKKGKPKSGRGKRKSGAVSTLNVLLLVQLILMFILSIGITEIISVRTIQSSDAYMTTIADERSKIITNYVESAENTLADYSHAGEIIRVLENPKDPDALREAQRYTEEFSADVVNLEGIYVSQWNTYVLAHTNAFSVGITTRTGEALRELQDALTSAADKVYDIGIISSPASGRQIVSMYKAVYGSDGTPLGLVGLGVYTDGLADVLDSLSRRDNDNSFYTMLDVSDGRYIFHRDENKVSAEAEIYELTNLCKTLRNTDKDVCGKFSYQLQGVNYVSMYSYIADRDWLFMIDDTEADIYSLTKSMRIYLILFCVFCFILIVLFNVINKKREDTARDLNSAVEKHERTRESLSNAVYNDFLTDIRNRISFSSDFEDGKVELSNDTAYYFALFNIQNFSKVNIVFGEEAGDMILVTTARILNQHFNGARVYRTGSDEFLVAQILQRGGNGYNTFLNSVNSAIDNVSKPFEAGETSISVSFSVIAAYRTKNVNISVLPAMKSLMEADRPESVVIENLDVHA